MSNQQQTEYLENLSDLKEDGRLSEEEFYNAIEEAGERRLNTKK